MKNRKPLYQRIWDRVIKNPDPVFNNQGEASLDPTPMAIPIGMQIPESLDMKLARLFRADHFRRKMAEQGMETFEEASNFGPDDDDPTEAPPQTLYQRHAQIAALQAVDRGLASPPPKEAYDARDRVAEGRKAKKAADKAAKESGSTEPVPQPSM